MVINTELTDKFNQDDFVDARKRPEELNSCKRILYEIERLLDVQDERLKIKYLNNRSRSKARITNKDLYRIYKSVVRVMEVEQRLVYNGCRIIDEETLKEAEEMGKSIEWFEPDL